MVTTKQAFLEELKALLKKYDAELIMRGNPKCATSEALFVEFHNPLSTGAVTVTNSYQLPKMISGE